MEKYRIKPFEELTIADDYLFKRVMSNKKLCQKLIERILEIKVKDLKYTEDEKTFSPGYLSKGVRLDVYVEDNNDVVYNLEMQVRNLEDDELLKRVRYYQAAIDTDILLKGEIYANLKETYIIFICPFSVLDGKRHKYTLKTKCQEDNGLDMDDGSTKIILSTKGELNDVNKSMKAFLDYVDGKIIKTDSFIKELQNEIKEIKSKEEERVNYMTFNLKMLEEREEGRKEGRKEGEKNTLIANVRNLMKNMGLSAKDAMNALSVSPENQKQLMSLI